MLVAAAFAFVSFGALAVPRPAGADQRLTYRIRAARVLASASACICAFALYDLLFLIPAFRGYD